MKARLNKGKMPNLSFFRDQYGFEVDLIADWKHTYAIEMKNKNEAEKDGTKAKVYYLGDDSINTDDVQ